MKIGVQMSSIGARSMNVPSNSKRMRFSFGSYKTSSSQEFELYFTPSLEFLGSEPKFAEPTARPESAVRSTAAKLVSDPNNAMTKT